MKASLLKQPESQIILETERTYLRRWTSDDLAAVGSLFGNAEVMANIGSGMPFPPDKVAMALLYFLEHYNQHGFGPWAVISKETHQVIGVNGLKYMPTFSHEDLGFAFLKEYWGKGLATETSLRVLEYGIHEMGLKNIGATVLGRNKASINVLVKLGMEYKETVFRSAVPTQVYLLKKS